MIEVRHLSAGYPEREVLTDVSIAFPEGKVTVLAGPNGSGKSTLVKTILGLLPKTGGEILFDGTDAAALSPRDIAKKAAYLAQNRNATGISARSMVLHGRFPYLGYPRRYRQEDRDIADASLKRADAWDLAERNVAELSGGQRQKVYLAMALAQDTGTIFLDEPTSFLDIRHQLDVAKIARELADEGRAVVMVLHDMPMAMRIADRLALLHEGVIRTVGTPDEVYASGLLDEVFGVRVCRTETPDGMLYYCL